MISTTGTRSASEVLEEQLQDAEFRLEWERTEAARALAHRIIAYRAERDMTQQQLAVILGMPQSAIARLESGEHEPTLKTIRRLATKLNIEFHIEITPDHLAIAS